MSGLYTMMTLGGFQFGVSTAAYQELKRTTEYLWPSQQLFGSAPAVQYVGKGDESISLPGVIYPEWNGGTGQVEAMRALAERKQPLLMIDGRGNVLGNWVIERVEESQAVFAQAGVARKQDFTISLKKFSDVGAAVNLTGSLPSLALPASAGISALPVISASLSPLSSAAAMVSSVTTTANAALSTASRLSAAAGGAITNVARAASALGIHAPGITKALTRAQDVANTVTSSARVGIDSMRRVQTAASAASAVRGMFNDVSALTQPATNSSTAIKTSLASLTAAGASADTLGVVTDALVTVNRVATFTSTLRDNTNTIMKKIGA